MSIERDDVQKIAALARLELPSEGLERLAGQLTSILDYIEVLKTVPPGSASSPPDGHGAAPALRPDLASNPPDSEFGLHQAPDREGAFFRVPRIIE